MISRRFLPSALLICLLIAGLALASSATAQPKEGEGTSPADMSLAGEVDLLKGTALYDPATGAATFKITLREAPGTNTEENAPPVEYGGGLVTSARPCTRVGVEEEEKAGGGYPTFAVVGFSEPVAGQPEVFSNYETSKQPPNPANFGPATKSVDGTQVTLAATDSKAINGPFTCAEVIAIPSEEPESLDLIVFPLVTPTEPPPPVVPTPAPAPPPPPGPAAAALAFGRLKPLTLQPDKWTPVRITLRNTGGTATEPGSLKLNLPRGLKVRPVSARQQVPAIAPGGSWTVAFRIKPSEGAKPKSTITLVGRAGSILARGSLVARLAAP